MLASSRIAPDQTTRTFIVNPRVLELGRHRSASSHLASEAKEAKKPIQREDEGDLTSQSSTKGKRYAPLRLIDGFTEYLTPRSRRHRNSGRAEVSIQTSTPRYDSCLAIKLCSCMTSICSHVHEGRPGEDENEANR